MMEIHDLDYLTTYELAMAAEKNGELVLWYNSTAVKREMERGKVCFFTLVFVSPRKSYHSFICATNLVALELRKV